MSFIEKQANISPYDFHGPGPNQCRGSCGWYQIDGSEVGGEVAQEEPMRLLRELCNFPFTI